MRGEVFGHLRAAILGEIAPRADDAGCVLVGRRAISLNPAARRRTLTCALLHEVDIAIGEAERGI